MLPPKQKYLWEVTVARLQMAIILLVSCNVFDDRKRPAIPAISLNNNTASLTAWSNDFKFETFMKDNKA